ncbi:DUF3040 domain-containing protein [Catellatospora sichuanensis]|uniref:DUF3040 domain-containing protein n=1 Tax=Catellatospora sichuanensis TaxID=1969805 RepID=UPI002482BA1F|nr:DUF3040 domain-containing protein [Catellatospora sichuanensis]
MPLTPNERRRLHEIEQQLARDDPAFATSMDGPGHPPGDAASRRPVLWWALAALAAVATSVVVAFVAGIEYAAILMLFMLAASAFMKLGLQSRSASGPPDEHGQS